jgi:chromatin structure-remodeling complex subunit RSC8
MDEPRDDGKDEVKEDIKMEDAPNDEPETADVVARVEAQNQANSVRQSELEVTDPEMMQRQIEEKARYYLANQLYRVIIPSFAAWYNRESINSIEEKSLPEFFNNRNRTKTPAVYKEYRDFMIDTYRLCPTEYLTVTACRRNLAGDVATIMRVHAFLEQWGLINYQIDPETRPSLIGPQYTGHFQITLDTPVGLQPLVPSKGSKESTGELSLGLTEKKIASSYDESSSGAVNLALRKSIYDGSADAAALMDESQRKFNAVNTRIYNCFTCGDDVTKVRYHNLQSKQTVGALCFKHGLFPANYQSSDFVKIEQQQSAGITWSEQEVLLLLEGIEMYEDDWEAVAYHVGTRSREQCIVKFLQLPIEDPYLAKNASNSNNDNNRESQMNGSQRSAAEKLLGELKEINGTSITSRSQDLATKEDRYQRELVTTLVEAELQKLELKLRKFEDLEAIMRVEQREIEMARTQLYLDRLSLKSQADSVLAKLRKATETSGEEALELAREAVRIAAKNPKMSVAEGESEFKQNVKTVKPTLKPISVDIPQTYKFWSA